MGIKLLSKNEIAKARNNDKALEIAEGLKISRKVDSLRELKAKEEESLEKFRSESLSAITKEISELSDKKDNIDREVKEARTELEKDISSCKREKLNLENLSKELSEKDKQIDKREIKVKIAESDVSIALNGSKDAVLRAENHEEAAKILHIKAFNEESLIKVKLENSVKVEDYAKDLVRNAEKKASLIEKNIIAREEILKNKEEEILKIKKELDEERIKLADQRGTLERAMERIKNKLK